jgi:predicted dehydrogenase
MAVVKAAVIGCGRMGVFTSESVRRFSPPCWMPQSHADAVAAHSGLTLAALCDPSGPSLERALARYSQAKGYSHHSDLLAALVPDVIGLATRTIGRAGIIQDFVAAGTQALHIEKPLCNSMSELQALEALFDREDIYVTYGALRRHFTVYKEAVAYATSGEFGNLQEVRVSMGGGQLFWTHAHSVDLILFAAGTRRPVAVQAVMSDFEDGDTGAVVENDPIVAAATIWFEDGAAGTIGRAAGSGVELCCDRGTIAVLNGGARVVADRISGDDPYPHPIAVNPSRFVSSVPEGTLAALRQLTDCLDGNQDAIADNVKGKKDILLGQRILFAMLESRRRRGARVTLDDVDPASVAWARSGALYA